MQDDIFPAAEKILSDIENVVKKNPSLKSFEIIPAEDNENKSPVFHQEDCLGLASWCVQPLYCYAYRRLFELRQNKHRREEPSTIARWLLGALLLNPDVTTFWNMRRELKYMFEFKELPRESLIKCPDDDEQCKDELYAYIKSNISDTGDRHKLQRLFDTMRTEFRPTSSRTEQQTYFCAFSYWVEECRVNESTICMYNDCEALWCHRRFLAYLLVRFIASYIKHSCRRDERADKSIETKNVQKKLVATNDDVTLCHDYLVEAFRTRTEKIADLATKRDQHEKMLVERFFKFLRSIGFETRS
ncbi:protein prenyltransferase alpha subunit repeat-containing protein tempura isoform X2 [Ptiloglossa arizonensis]|uniref:protein prenyltransferase alpha subunit repeat-containing protein tempura isoform X2 n=1 Tax=Ptiloglossa arizonensis TaxID=3350558 RepID=UPI003F9EE2F4